MRGYVGLGLWIIVGGMAATATAQNPPAQPSVYDRPAVQTQDPAPPQWPRPVEPVLQRRAASQPPAEMKPGPQPPPGQPGMGPGPQQPPAPPFQLTPEQQADVDRVLRSWEQYSARVKRFECQFTRFEYDGVFGDPNRPREDQGEVKYAAPDKAMFRILGDAQNVRPEHWICDGKSIFQYDFSKKQIVEYKLPPEMQGSAIADGPVPFLFGAKAERLKQRYFLRVIAEQSNNSEVWLQAFPRTQEEAKNFHHAEVILAVEQMLPNAIQLHQPNGKSRTVYRFNSPRVNPIDPIRQLDSMNLFNSNPFRPNLPGRDWTRVVEEAPARQVDRQEPASRR
jgi:TIGR03009 family protein